MYLKSIRANGFKSFADKIEINIDHGITCVVGPNGSGKSNILDAIRWVLGEQSVKALRGDNSMIDVIFTGSKSRSSANRASVSLTFDNSDHYLNTEFDTVEIKRTVYKSGENEYYINNAKVRLKDITDLFLDSGASRESFNIISQGAVSDIINSKPEDRRIIIESAAGVLKYKKRKEETYRKLDKTNENLARVNLLIDELHTTIKPLEEQAMKARQYLDLKKDLESIEIALIANDITTLNNEYNNVKEQVRILTSEVEKMDFSNVNDSSKIEKLKLDSLKLDKEIDDKNSIIMNLANDIASLQSKKQVTIERQKYEADTDKVENSIVSMKEEILDLENNLKQVENDLQGLKNSYETKQLEVKESSNLLNTKENELKKIINSINDNNKELMNLNNRIDILENNINNDAKTPFAVKSVINNIRLKGIHNVLYKLIDIKEEYITAIETTLGANSNVIVVDDEVSATKAIEYLKEQKLGRATFFPISIIKGKSINDEDINVIKKFDGFIGVASNLVEYDKKYQSIIDNQLGNVIVVDNIDTLNQVGKKIKYRYKIVSLDGEISYAGGAITGGKSKKKNSVIEEKLELDKLNVERQELIKLINHLGSQKEQLDNELDKLNKKNEVLTRDLIIEKETYSVKNNGKEKLTAEIKRKKEELDGLNKIANSSLSKELDDILKQYYEKVNEKDTESKKLDKLKKDKSDLVSEIECLEKENRDKNYEITKKQNDLKNEEIKMGKLDVRLDNLLATLSETYNLTYERANLEYSLGIDEGTARQTVNNIKYKIKSLGEVNTGSISEYERLNERYMFLTTQRNDLEQSVTSLINVISEMDEIMKTKFVETFEKVKNEFSIVFKKLFKGGEGILSLTNPQDILTTGVDISAIPPGKKLNSLALLSGGEKTLTAIALLFAILNVKTVPFVVLDEVEAALDEANVDAFGKYLLTRKSLSQFIIITHKKRTMEYADCLYGITMQESGVSKLVSVKLEN